jgi:hypothetical protein
MAGALLAKPSIHPTNLNSSPNPNPNPSSSTLTLTPTLTLTLTLTSLEQERLQKEEDDLANKTEDEKLEWFLSQVGGDDE